MIYYSDDISSISTSQLKGFFEGWKKPLTPEQHYRLLCGSTHFVVAIDGENGKTAGFVTAISDGVLTGYIPLIEVLPEYRGMGIGTRLMDEILLKLKDISNIDLICDDELRPFYERFNMRGSTGMVLRKFLDISSFKK